MSEKLTRTQIAARLQISVRSLDRRIAEGSIPCKRLGRRIVLDLAEVWAALPPAGRARVAAMPPSATRRPIDLAAALRYKAQHWCDPPPDELAARRKQKEGRHGT